MEHKPIITCHGDQALFAKLHNTLSQNLPKEPVEWKRSYGRPRNVHIDGIFVPFSTEILPTERDRSLIKVPFFHSYWTDCDTDVYKASVKEDISHWLARLKERNISDWLIVSVNYDDGKKKLLPRSTVIDRVKSDFCSKYPDRCLSLRNPLRMDSRSMESWQALLQRIRQLAVLSIDRNVSKYEEHMRAQRERRTEAGWSFSKYFMLQEELAFMLEMLGLFEEAMIQYDELDALFTQFVVNHAAGVTVQWLTSFSQNITCWEGLSLSHTVDKVNRGLIEQNKASLLDFRNYLLSRQCSLLLMLNRPWEVASRSIPFIHNTVQELGILDLSLPRGAIACWVFLSCREVLQTCERYNDTSQIVNYSLHTASLWEYSRKKLKELGELCGLMPDCETSSHHLNTVVDLIAGLQHQSMQEERPSVPCDKLREALSSKEHFQKHYLESIELAMGTFKHIGRLRSARMIGKDLAQFYLSSGEYPKAESFLIDAYKMYRYEGWHELADTTRIEIADCQLLQGCDNKYIRSCIVLSGSKTLPDSTRKKYMDNLVQKSTQLDSQQYLRLSTLFALDRIFMSSRRIVCGDTVKVELEIHSKLPESIVVDISIAVARTPGDQLTQSTDNCLDSSNDDSRYRSSSICSTTSTTSSGEVALPKFIPSFSETVALEEHYEYKRKDLLVMSSLVYRPLSSVTGMKRHNSNPQLVRDKEITKDNYASCLHAQSVTLSPGGNNVVITGKAEEQSNYLMTQLCIVYNRIEFLRSLVDINLSYSIVWDNPTVSMSPVDHDCLFGGLAQNLSITVHSGSGEIKAGYIVRLRTPSNMRLSISEIVLPELKPYQDYTETAIVITEFVNVPEIQYQVMIEYDWLNSKSDVDLNFLRPFSMSHKVHTIIDQKFIQIMVRNESQEKVHFMAQQLEVSQAGEELTNPKPDSIHETSPGDKTMFAWNLSQSMLSSSSCEFRLSYRNDKMTKPQSASYEISINKILYNLNTSITSDGKLYQYQLEVSPVDELPASQLMYEISCDPKYWLIHGKYKGMLQDNNATISMEPICKGNLPFPSVQIYRYESNSMDGIKNQVAIDEREIYDSSPVLNFHIPDDGKNSNCTST